MLTFRHDSPCAFMLFSILVLTSCSTTNNDPKPQQMRKQANLDTEGTKHMLSVWVHRGYIALNDSTQMYEKTEKYKLQKAA